MEGYHIIIDKVLNPHILTDLGKYGPTVGKELFRSNGLFLPFIKQNMFIHMVIYKKNNDYLFFWEPNNKESRIPYSQMPISKKLGKKLVKFIKNWSLTKFDKKLN